MKKKILLLTAFFSFAYLISYANKSVENNLAPAHAKVIDIDSILSKFNNESKEIEALTASACLDAYLTYCNSIQAMYDNSTRNCINTHSDNPDANLSCQFAAADTYFAMHAMGDYAYNVCTSNNPVAPAH